jgi:hypothetical protein
MSPSDRSALGIREWLGAWRRRRDAAATERAAAVAGGSRAERVASPGDLTGVAADQQAARIAGQTPAEAERLGE